MTATVSNRGQVLLPKAVRDAAKVRVGDKLEGQCEGNGQIVLRRARSSRRALPRKPLLNVEPFPSGTLKAIYRESDPEWEAVEAAAVRAQPPPNFDP
ncbi:MAG TPA: AbrB/MazE/SpoVT family DNA-binding domain-containing protein [Verrucomicrobiota bacterium]|nr:AbrB/MazE/SpoVT family DNA-binding domain-containing protein [Verrucomicrobiota bacterium]